jgi:hypothetical protein
VPQRLAELMSAIGREQDPAVRGRAAVLLLRDLTRARVAAEQCLDGAIRDLRARGLSEDRIDELLDLPAAAAETRADR